ncbi:MAG: YdcF family protein [Fibrobacter sp.]|nr:YdcF family protein [Fibrobacter sp.]
MIKIKRWIYRLLTVVISMTVLIFSLKKQVKEGLGEFLTKSVPPPQTQIDVLYVLGGTFKSTYYHIKTAAMMNKILPIKKIMVLHTDEKILPGSYDSTVDKDQWVLKKLEENEIHSNDVEFLYTEGKLFGTLSESVAFRKYTNGKEIRSALIVTSKHHTRRAGLCFSHLLEQSHIQVYVTGSEHLFDFKQMFIELFKYIVYRYVLLNFY